MVRAIGVGVWALFAALAAAGLLAPRTVRAQDRAPTPLVVLALMTDDADDQADALTRALKARVDALPAWSLEESTQSFETLSIALRCPSKPDSACLGRIGDQLHADHFVWGTMVRGRGEVTAELNLWNRSGPAAQTSAMFPDNLKDPEGPKLRAVAVRVLDSLLGGPAEPPPVVHGKPATGSLPTPPPPEPTSHAPAASDSTPPAESPPSSDSNHLPRILGYTGLASGAVLLVVGAIEGAMWVSDKNKADQQRSMVPSNVVDVCAAPGYAAAAAACQASTREMNDAVFAWVFTVAGAALAGTGIWLLVASGGSSDAKPATAHPTLEVLPTIGSQVQSLDLRLHF
jgi:hypothetical protein